MTISFEQIHVGKEYERSDLVRIWGYQSHHAISKGIVTPKNTHFIILFVTEEKYAANYNNSFDKTSLYVDGEKGRARDKRIIESTSSNDEVHLFHRRRHRSPFTYEGRIYLCDYEFVPGMPTRFHFKTSPDLVKSESTLLTERIARGDIGGDDFGGKEGKKRIRQHISYERNLRNRALALKIHGRTCHACGFDFDAFYGAELANGFIEIHHIRPVSELGNSMVDPRKDLAPLCSNCHSMVHRIPNKMLSIEELKAKIQKMHA